MTGPVPVRIDKWLWAARFFKTRTAATTAVAGGKAAVNGERAKPATLVRPGDAITLRIAPFDYHLVVTGTAERRGSVAAAQALYTETDDSRAARERHAELLRLAPQPGFGAGRPSTRDRRLLGKLRRKD